MPSPDEITTVRSNIQNMITFNNDLLTQIDIKMQTAVSLLSQAQNPDLGMQIGVNLLGGGFWALGSLFGPLGNIPANFLSGLVASYATSVPPALNTVFANMLIRLQSTINQTNEDLAVCYQDPVSNWEKNVNGSFETPFGKYTVNGSVGTLALIQFPAQTDPAYYPLLNGVLKAVEQGIWATFLKSFVITHYIESNPPLWKLPCNPDQEDNAWLPFNKSYYHTWAYHDDVDCYGNHVQYYDREEYNIGTGAGPFSDGALSDAACDYMFQNYASAPENPDGLFRREFVFTKLGIPITDHFLRREKRWCRRYRR